MKKKFLKPNDRRLRKASQAIPLDQLNSSQVKRVAKLMLKIIQGEQEEHKKGVGLAAPQIGIFKRIILVDVAANEQVLSVGNKKGHGGDLRIYVNPEIIWSSKKEGEWYEGCYSTGNICGIVSRPTAIKIRALRLHTGCVRLIPHPVWKFEKVEERWTGYAARIFQHEIDHLNGKVFIDHITNPDHLHWVEEKEFPTYRDQQAWKTWPKKASFNVLKY